MEKIISDNFPIPITKSATIKTAATILLISKESILLLNNLNIYHDKLKIYQNYLYKFASIGI